MLELFYTTIFYFEDGVYMLDLFRQLKLEYKEYVILFKSGNFYLCIDEDATIMNHIFHYKITELKNNIKVGFPISLLDKNIDILSNKRINYIVIENKQIVNSKKFELNNYNQYSSSPFHIISKYSRIKNISEKLKNISDDKLNMIEGIING